MEQTSKIFEITGLGGQQYFVIFKEHLNYRDAEEKINENIDNVTNIKMLSGDIVYI